MIDRIRWQVRTGAPWRDVPARYGPWARVYELFRCRQLDGTWAQILAELQARAGAAGLDTWDVSVDSTIVRAHQHAAGAPREGPPTEPADYALGRSRGRFTTKIHLACEHGRTMLSTVVTAGQRADGPQFTTVLGRIRVARLGPGRPRYVARGSARPSRSRPTKPLTHVPALANRPAQDGVSAVARTRRRISNTDNTW